MKPTRLIELAREDAQTFVDKCPDHRLMPTGAWMNEQFKRSVPQRERDAGDLLIYRATLAATVQRLRGERG